MKAQGKLTIETTMDFKGGELEVSFVAANMWIEHDTGIGAYEFWGARGHDSGSGLPYVEDYDIVDLEAKKDGIMVSNPDELAEIEKAIYDSDDVWETINSQLFEEMCNESAI